MRSAQFWPVVLVLYGFIALMLGSGNGRISGSSSIPYATTRQFARKGLTIFRPAKSLSFSVTTTQ